MIRNHPASALPFVAISALVAIYTTGCLAGDLTLSHDDSSPSAWLRVDSIAPTTISARGGEAIVIRGHGLADVEQVTLGEAEAELASVEDTLLRVIAPPTTSGARRFALTSAEFAESVVVEPSITVRALPLRYDEAAGPILPSDSRPRTAIARDLDGDGDDDVVVGAQRGAGTAIFLNDEGELRDVPPTGVALARLPNAPGEVRDIVVFDVDTDGDLDLLFLTTPGSIAKLYANQGDATFLEVGDALPPEIDDAVAGAVADLDGDGSAELVVADGATGGPAVRIFDNHSTASVISFDNRRVEMPDTGETASDVLLSDLDADHDRDILLVQPDAADGHPHVTLLDNELPRGFTAADWMTQPSFPDGVPGLARTLDLGSDGDLDVVFVGDGQDHLLSNQGDGLLRLATDEVLPVDDVPGRDVAVSDVNRDGMADLVIANHGFQNRLYMSGEQTLTDATSFLPVARGPTASVLVFDANGDGADDILFIDGNAQTQLLLWRGSDEGGVLE